VARSAFCHWLEYTTANLLGLVSVVVVLGGDPAGTNEDVRRRGPFGLVGYTVYTDINSISVRGVIAMSKQTGNRQETQADRDARLREMILLIAMRSEGDETFGAVKLNKLLFYADFSAYVRFGESITGQEYEKLINGPAPRRMLPVIEKMKKKDLIAIRERDYYGKNQQRAFALSLPDTSRFEYEQLDLVERVIKRFWGKNATEMSAMSHRFLGWRLAAIGEIIPYSAALIGSREPTAEEKKRGLALESMALACKGEGTLAGVA
jgi:hypothetical protein